MNAYNLRILKDIGEGMSNSAKRSQHIDEVDIPEERRKSSERRVSPEVTRFPFIDKNSKLVMKDRRSSDRRDSDVKFKDNPLKVVSNFFKK